MTHKPKRQADVEIEKSDGGDLTCPHCRHQVHLDPLVRESILDTLRGWDRRFDGPESVLEIVLDALALERPRSLPDVSRKRFAR
jgi:hypothetical protein